MKSIHVLLLIAAIMGFAATAQGEMRAWKNQEGVEIQAELVGVEGDKVTLRMANGKSVTFSQDKLSAADRQWINALPEDQKSPPKPKGSVPSNRVAKWNTQMSQAKTEAQKTGLPILVLFTGSDWCTYCIKLEKEVFKKEEFKDFANQNLVLLIYDFPADGKAKAEAKQAAKDYRVGGYPTYYLITADGKNLGSNGYAGGISPKSFAGWVNAIAPKR